MLRRLAGKAYKYRGFVLGSVKREFVAKYQNSLLGGLWSVVNPLSMILIYTLVFSKVMQSRLPGIEGGFSYSIYLCSGLFFWGFFSETVSRLQSVFIDNANLLKKVSFPRVCLPINVLLVAAINFVIVLFLFFVFLLVVGELPGWEVLSIFPLLFLQVVLALGLGVALGVVNVFFRDVGQFFAIFLQFWFWLTPIVYPASVLPESVRDWLLLLNPMAALVSGYQAVFVFHQWPSFHSFVSPLGCALLFVFVGVRLFSRHAADMVDEL